MEVSPVRRAGRLWPRARQSAVRITGANEEENWGNVLLGVHQSICLTSAPANDSAGESQELLVAPEP